MELLLEIRENILSSNLRVPSVEFLVSFKLSISVKSRRIFEKLKLLLLFRFGKFIILRKREFF